MSSGVALVVPTCRPEMFRDFLAAWEPVRFWDYLVVVEDGPRCTPELTALADAHHSWEGIDAMLGPDAWVISRRDSAIRSYGFLLAWRLGCDLVVTLDDDTRPAPGVDLLAGHRKALDGQPQWVSSVEGVRVRGLPYGPWGHLPHVMANVGLWRGVPDLDAACSLAKGVPGDFEPDPGSRVVPRGQYVPVCGMNFAFRREFTPLAYFGLQGEGSPFARFDDIWMGVVAKRVCDHLGWSVAVGEPFVEHRRASDPLRNLVREAPGVAFHEHFWRVVDSTPLTAATAADCLREVADAFRRDGHPYLDRLGRAMRVWAGLFDPEGKTP